MRKRWRWVVAGSGVALIALAAFVLWPRQPRITRETCGRVGQGMTRAEVESLLGPPGDYRTGPVDYDRGLVPIKITPIINGGLPPSALPNTYRAASDDDIARWTGDSAYIAVQFNPDDGRVETWYVVPTSKAAQSPLSDLLWRLRRQWHRWSPN